jgi:hypothetical protein
MTCLLNSWLRPKYGKTLLRRRRVRPGLRLERLEDRWVPAQTFTVQNEAQLVIAITKSNTDAVNGSTDFDNPDIIQFAVPGPGTPTITLTADLPANSGFLSIQGASQAGVTINGNGFRVFVNTNKLIIDSLTITGGLAPAGAGGGAINSTNFLILSNSALTSNTSAAQGGGLANSGTALVINCTFTNNHAVSGGGVANSGENGHHRQRRRPRQYRQRRRHQRDLPRQPSPVWVGRRALEQRVRPAGGVYHRGQFGCRDGRDFQRRGSRHPPGFDRLRQHERGRLFLFRVGRTRHRSDHEIRSLRDRQRRL